MRRKKGKVKGFVGSMMSGKTESLIREARRYVYAKKKVQIFKHAIDDRFDEEYVVSHSGEKIKATPIEDIRDIMKHLQVDTDVVGIEEVQFFNSEYTINVVNALRNMGVHVIFAGLDMTYDGKPFGVVPQLMAIANEVEKLKAICLDCGEEAYISHRITDCTEEVQVGASESYVPLCYDCYCKRIKM